MVEPSDELQVVFEKAIKDAKKLRHEYVTLEHLFFAMLCSDNFVKVLDGYGCKVDSMKEELNDHLQNKIDEIKVSDEDFPPQIPESLGYKYFNYGQKGFHGVAIFSKIEPTNVIKGLNGGDDEAQKRYIQCDFQTSGGVMSLCNSYFPQGENRKHPDKFPYKEFPRVLPERNNEGFYGGAWPDNTGQN